MIDTNINIYTLTKQELKEIKNTIDEFINSEIQFDELEQKWIVNFKRYFETIFFENSDIELAYN